MAYFPTFTIKDQPNVGKYTIHWVPGFLFSFSNLILHRPSKSKATTRFCPRVFFSAARLTAVWANKMALWMGKWTRPGRCNLKILKLVRARGSTQPFDNLCLWWINHPCMCSICSSTDYENPNWTKWNSVSEQESQLQHIAAKTHCDNYYIIFLLKTKFHPKLQMKQHVEKFKMNP